MRTPTVAAALVFAMMHPAGARQQSAFKTGVVSVSVEVSVSASGKPVRGLSAAELVVTDNHVAQTAELAIGRTPVDLSLVVDMSALSMVRSSGLNVIEEFTSEAKQIADSLTPGDRLQVITFATRVDEVRPMKEVGAEPAPIHLDNVTAGGTGAAVTDAALYALSTQSPPDRRHVVVLFSRGFHQGAALPLDRLAALAGRSDAILDVVLTPPVRQVRSRTIIPFYPTEVATRSALARAAEATGGEARVTGDAVGAVKDILEEFRSSYVLRYTLRGVPSTGWHDITVTVPSCPTCTIRARKGYFGQ